MQTLAVDSVCADERVTQMAQETSVRPLRKRRRRRQRSRPGLRRPASSLVRVSTRCRHVYDDIIIDDCCRHAIEETRSVREGPVRLAFRELTMRSGNQWVPSVACVASADVRCTSMGITTVSNAPMSKASVPCVRIRHVVRHRML